MNFFITVGASRTNGTENDLCQGIGREKVDPDPDEAPGLWKNDPRRRLGLDVELVQSGSRRPGVGRALGRQDLLELLAGLGRVAAGLVDRELVADPGEELVRRVVRVPVESDPDPQVVDFSLMLSRHRSVVVVASRRGLAFTYRGLSSISVIAET